MVDDDAISRELLGLLLESEGFAVCVSESGDEALELLNGVHVTAPDVVLADLHMPGICGAELAVALRGASRGGTVLVGMSGTRPAAEVEALFDAFLMKPLSVESLHAAVTCGRAGAARDGARDFTGRDAEYGAGRDAKYGAGQDAEYGGGERVGDGGRYGAGEGAEGAGYDGPEDSVDRRADSVGRMEAEAGGVAGEPAARPAGDPLDGAVYAKLVAMMPLVQLQELYRICVGDVRERVERMREFADGGDAAAFRKEAHAIKGGSSMLGACEMASMARAMELGAAEGWTSARALEQIEELTLACNRFESILVSITE